MLSPSIPWRRPFLIGVVHLLPTPGAPRHGEVAGGMEEILRRAIEDAGALARGGADGLLVENFGDRPFFPERVPPETIAALTLAVEGVRRAVPDLPIGVNVLRNDARAALGVCAVAGADFLRVNVHTGAMVTDQGLLQGRAAETLRERARLAPGALLFADVHVKHASPLGRIPLATSARDLVQRGLADAVIVTGDATGSAPDPAMIAEVRRAVGETPLVVGSGVGVENAAALLAGADGAIVGTSLKVAGDVSGPVDEGRVRALKDLFDGAGRRMTSGT